MKERIVLSIVSIFMLALTLKKGDKRTIFLTVLLTIGILLIWIRVDVIIIIGIFTYMLTALFTAITNLRGTELTKLHQATIIISGIWAFIYNLFSIMHWPFANEIRLSMLIPIMFYIISMFYGMIKRKEFGYLTILNAQFLLRLIG